MKKALTAWLFTAAIVAPVHAADRTVVHAGHLLDVDSGRMLTDQAVTLADGKVVAVQPWSADAAKGARVLDWSAWTVVPGLMDMHTHISEEAETADIAAPLKISPAQQAFIGAMNARKTLQAGFTTVRDVGVYRGFADIALRDAIDAGEIPGPRMFVAGAYITAPGGGGEVTGLPPGTVVPPAFRQGVSKGEDEVRRHLDPADLQGVIYSDGELAAAEISLETAELLRAAGPWGQGFPEPVFDGAFEVQDCRRVGERHLKLLLARQGMRAPVEAIAFNCEQELAAPGQIHIAYRLDVNEFRGRLSPQLIVEWASPL